MQSQNQPASWTEVSLEQMLMSLGLVDVAADDLLEISVQIRVA